MIRNRRTIAQRPAEFRLNPQHPLSRGLVFAGLGCMPGGTMYWDSSPRRNHGTLTGFTGAGKTPPERWRRLHGRAVLRFDGQKVINATPAWQAAFPFSMSCRIKWESGWGGYQYIVSSMTNSSGAFFAIAGYWNGSAYVPYYYQGGGRYSSKTLSLNVWYHVAISFDSASSVRWWIDGQPTAIDQPSGAFTLSSPWLVIGDIYSGGLYFYGQLEDAVFHARSLSDSDVGILASQDPLYGDWIVPVFRRIYFCPSAAFRAAWPFVPAHQMGAA